MTNPTSSDPAEPVRALPTSTTRRRFLQLAGVGALGAVGAVGATNLVDRLVADRPGSGPTARAFGRAFGRAPGRTGMGAPDPGLVLVSIQLGGGVDFLNTVVPLDDRDYQRVRGAGALRPDDGAGAPTLFPIDSSYALNSMPHLAERFAAGQVAIVHGVGSEGSSLSHFEATDMWEKGSTDFGTTSGWLGRAMADHAGVDGRGVADGADAMGAGAGVDPLLAVSLGGVSPSMSADGWSPVGLRPDLRIPWSADFTSEYRALDRALDDLSPDDGSDLWSMARDSQLDLRGIGARLGPIVGGREPSDDEGDDAGEGGDDAGYLGHQLDLVADLIAAGLPTRAFHVSHDGYDTHDGQAWLLPELHRELDAAIERFQRRLGPDADRVVVATWSEFGRRPEWNGEGTEHGTAGAQFVIGPRVAGGHHGEPPPLDRFDDDGNFLVTTDFRDYLAGLTLGTLGADPARVVDGGRGPLDLVRA